MQQPEISIHPLIGRLLIIRKDYGEIPPRVEYSLSERGKSLEPVLDAFCLWGQEHQND